MKPKFDGYAAQYDAWFMENENVFQSEFRLFEKALGDISGKRVLSVGCGSGLFESMIDCKNIEGVEPSRDMGAIAQKRGINVIAFGAIEEVELEENAYDIIYLNGSSSYMEDLTRAFDVCKKATQAERQVHFAGCAQGERVRLHVPSGQGRWHVRPPVPARRHAQAAVSARAMLRGRVALDRGKGRRAQIARLPRF